MQHGVILTLFNLYHILNYIIWLCTTICTHTVHDILKLLEMCIKDVNLYASVIGTTWRHACCTLCYLMLESLSATTSWGLFYMTLPVDSTIEISSKWWWHYLFKELGISPSCLIEMRIRLNSTPLNFIQPLHEGCTMPYPGTNKTRCGPLHSIQSTLQLWPIPRWKVNLIICDPFISFIQTRNGVSGLILVTILWNETPQHSIMQSMNNAPCPITRVINVNAILPCVSLNDSMDCRLPNVKTTYFWIQTTVSSCWLPEILYIQVIF